MPNASNLDFNIYPNPAKNSLTINNLEQHTKVTLFDANGNELIQLQSEGSELTINISQYSSGIYFIKVGTQTAKVIIE